MKSILTAIIIVFISSLYGQEMSENQVQPIARNTVFVEYGPGLTINYDHVFWQKEKLKFSAGVGLLYFHARIIGNLLYVPAEVNVFYGKTHHIEFGTGYAAQFSGEWRSNSADPFDYDQYIYVRWGYRYQMDESNRTFFRFSWAPVYSFEANDFISDEPRHIMPLQFSVSVGLTLKNRRKKATE